MKLACEYSRPDSLLRRDSGKSLIFHIAPLAEMWMYSHAPNAKIWTKEPIIIIISPLIALMKDQVKRLNEVKYIQYVFNIFISNI